MFIILLGLVFGFFFLVKGADLLVNGASGLAKRLGVSDLLIGLTVVAFGTSMPELFVNIFASFQGRSDIAIGNILGSNTVNVLLIAGISAVIFPLRVMVDTVRKEIPLSLLAAVLVLILANDRVIDAAGISVLSRIDGIVLLCFFIIFLFYIFELALHQEDAVVAAGQESLRLLPGFLKPVLLVIFGLLAMVVGSRMVVLSAVDLAARLGLSQALIGLTIVAVGTSLPELATSAVAAYKKNSDIAVGNIVGSNIFNIFFILGVSALIKPLPFNVAYNLDILITICASLLLFLCMFTGKKQQLDKWEGILFVLLYLGYIIVLVIRG